VGDAAVVDGAAGDAWGDAAPPGSVTLDPTFAGTGYYAFSGPVPAEDYAAAAAVDSAGRLVVVGNQGGSWIAVGRFSASGALDPAFASVGYVTYKALPSAFGARLRVDALGRVIVAGSSRPRGVGLDRDLTVWRFNSDGALDATFGASGYLAHDGAAGAAGEEAATDLALDADGAIYACGTVAAGTSRLAIWRLLSDGRLDPAFGTGGVVVDGGGTPPAGPAACRLDGRGRLVVAGTTTDGFGVPKLTLWRFLRSGALDPSFDGAPRVAATAFAGRDEHVRSLTLVGADRAVVCGNVGADAAADMAVWRLVLPP
jgi:uncharacterized delta-60 repeat protein